MINIEKQNFIKNKANEIRISIIEMLHHAGSGHTAGALGMADIFSTLFFYSMRYDVKNLSWNMRDRLVLSNGHICPVLYATEAHAGYFDLDRLLTLRKFGSILQGHPHREFLKSIETSSGPLGSGLSQAIGMAIALKKDSLKSDDKSPYVYCIISDGEHNEGQIWEAALLAPRECLDNLIVFVDRNNIQIGGDTEKVLPLNPIDKKWEAFNWHVQSINGNNIDEIINSIQIAKDNINKPSIIIANTIPGKGVSFMENDYKWHGKAPNKEECDKALSELRSVKL